MPEPDVVKAAESASKAVALIDRFRPLSRVLYPGLAVALFLEHRYAAPVFRGLGGESLPSIALSLLLGTLVYFTYRALVHPVVWFFQARTLVGMPARETHRRIVDSICKGLDGSPLRDSVLVSQACLAQFQAETLSTERRAETAAYNAGSHILYLTATLGLLFLIHDAFLWPFLGRTGIKGVEIAGWIMLFVVGLSAAVVYDRTADYREVIALWRHEDRYREVVQCAMRCWTTGLHRFSYRERIIYLLGDGALIAVLAAMWYVAVRVILQELPVSWLVWSLAAAAMWWYAASRLWRFRLRWLQEATNHEAQQSPQP